MDKPIIELQRQIFEQTSRRTDAHYEEGMGVLFVPEGTPLVPTNVILAVEEMQLHFMRMI